MVRMGVIGVGGMGSSHARRILADEVRSCKLAAVCDIDPGALEAFPGLEAFSESGELLRSGLVDAVLIATPHYLHTTIGIDALQQGLHVLVEKPISVHKADCERLLAAHRGKEQVFAAMLNRRTTPCFREARRLVLSGELGRISRIGWISTCWYRNAAYYRSGGWRATWKGEGGGVLMNQSPHQLDLLWWLFGMPIRVRGFCGFGKGHDIEVEDEATAFLEYPGGMTGVFVASTCEYPGTDRLEAACDMGRLIVEEDRLKFLRTEVGLEEFSRTSRERFGKPGVREVPLPDLDSGGQHLEVLQNFVDAVEQGIPLIAPAAEGIHSVELANAILLSSHLDRPVDLPLDSEVFGQHISRLIAQSNRTS
jgi:predicted dehydrogenase